MKTSTTLDQLSTFLYEYDIWLQEDIRKIENVYLRSDELQVGRNKVQIVEDGCGVQDAVYIYLPAGQEAGTRILFGGY